MGKEEESSKGEESDFENQNDGGNNLRRPTYKNSREYIEALEKWLQQAYMWQCVSAYFPYMFYNQQLTSGGVSASPSTTSVQNSLPPGFYPFPGFVPQAGGVAPHLAEDQQRVQSQQGRQIGQDSVQG